MASGASLPAPGSCTSVAGRAGGGPAETGKPAAKGSGRFRHSGPVSGSSSNAPWHQVRALVAEPERTEPGMPVWVSPAQPHDLGLVTQSLVRSTSPSGPLPGLTAEDVDRVLVGSAAQPWFLVASVREGPPRGCPPAFHHGGAGK